MSDRRSPDRGSGCPVLGFLRSHQDQSPTSSFRNFFGYFRYSELLPSETIFLDFQSFQVSLFGKKVLNSLLGCLDDSFHPVTKQMANNDDDDVNLPSVISHVIHIQLEGPLDCQNRDFNVLSRVRLILHLGVVVEGIDEEQLVMTDLTVLMNSTPNSRSPVLLTLDSGMLDQYLDFSNPRFLGLDPLKTHVIADLPPSEPAANNDSCSFSLLSQLGTYDLSIYPLTYLRSKNSRVQYYLELCQIFLPARLDELRPSDYFPAT